HSIMSSRKCSRRIQHTATVAAAILLPMRKPHSTDGAGTSHPTATTGQRATERLPPTPARTHRQLQPSPSATKPPSSPSHARDQNIPPRTTATAELLCGGGCLSRRRR